MRCISIAPRLDDSAAEEMPGENSTEIRVRGHSRTLCNEICMCMEEISKNTNKKKNNEDLNLNV